MRSEAGLFPAVLRHWRTRRGWSQLDLALTANISSRHVSFLETGRAQPSREMVLRLGETLDLPLRDRNAMLHAAGFEHAFAEPTFEGGLPPPLAQALDRMSAQQEPYPLVVMNRRFDVLRANDAAWRMFARAIADPEALPKDGRMNIMRMLFDPRLARPFVLEWDRVAHAILSRLQREQFSRPNDNELASLLEEILAMPDVPKAWQKPDLSVPVEPTLVLRVRRDDLELAFLTTLTVFQAPQNVLLDEIVIESYFPYDQRTADICASLERQTC